eukprot:CAMPEP_0197189552 /NCGR_PEP_ID=MMETSP1423-20130617/19965_1 /TAXON_ID=476441 /ORGANISM="Pseudo-nitzschia heimii, Strain UNC1101" /LENGTH=599 /DNA_ID=CAMNT_0042641693 /DNA_START=31 /DNA_END=1827 /DNA_ORIENTATION=-
MKAKASTTLRRRASNLAAATKKAKTSAALPFLAILFSHTSTVAFSSNSNSNTKTNNGHRHRHQHRRRRSIMSLRMDTDDLAVQANSYASANGIQVERRRNNNDDDPSSSSYFEGAPMSLLPNAYPGDAFAQAVEVAPDFNELVDRVSRDAGFLESTLGGGVSAMDPYTARILKLYKEIYDDSDDDSNGDASKAAARSADRLGILRSDYMLHKEDGDGDESGYQLKQVELNTIASSFAGLSCKIAGLHRYLTTRYESETADFLRANVEKISSSTSSSSSTPSGVPENPALTRLPAAMKAAYDRYVSRFSEVEDDDERSTTPPPVVLFVVQEGETNTVDQRLLEFALWEDHGIPVVRRSLTALDAELSQSSDGVLKLKEEDGGLREVAVVYFRAGYAPTDYPGGDDGPEWRARSTLERSRAVKCPSLGYHLAGTKKVQQELARPGVLERFFPSDAEADKVARMRACFAGLYSTGEDATDRDKRTVADVVTKEGASASYVLKPQREGGGYNFYGDDLLAKLRENVVVVAKNDDGGDGDSVVVELDPSLGEYILMQRLFPPEQTAILLRGGRVEGSGSSISELGIFGTVVVDSEGKVLRNTDA